MNIFRYFWLAVFALFIGVAAFLAEDIFYPQRSPFPPGSLESRIHEDFRKLHQQNQMPENLQDIEQVFILDNRVQKFEIRWAQLSALHFPKKVDGNYHFQIEVFDAQDEESKELIEILQFSLFEKNTKDKIWELSRSYHLPLQKR